jgi:hypothetical protein
VRNLQVTFSGNHAAETAAISTFYFELFIFQYLSAQYPHIFHPDNQAQTSPNTTYGVLQAAPDGRASQKQPESRTATLS